ncbi:MAG TPA: anion transporter [Gemmataceae bacterium]|nr:anion transporter [Gemmataceae bacterium]
MDGLSIVWLTSILFILTYAGLALGKIPGLRMDRAGIALVGAALMLVTGIITLQEAISPQSIDYETLILLFGMMIVVGCLRLSGFFRLLAHWCLDRIETPRGLLAVTIVLSGVLSAFLVNDIVCLALTPLILHLARRLRFNPVPHLIGLATASNIGSTGTITGNPQNMIIGIQSHISYLRFAARLFPAAALGLVINFAVIAFIYRRSLIPPKIRYALSRDRKGAEALSNGRGSAIRRAHLWLLCKSILAALVAVVLFFVLPSQCLPLIALGAAAFLLVGRIVNPEKIYRQIDWSLLVMFAGLFVVVHAFQMHVVARWGIDGWTWLLNHPVDLLSGVSAALSNLVSNVPAVLLFEPVMRAMPSANQETAWLALAMSSTFAGNLTVLGSVANLIVVENARREGVSISFWEYCKVGVPLTFVTLLLGIAWLKFVPY